MLDDSPDANYDSYWSNCWWKIVPENATQFSKIYFTFTMIDVEAEYYPPDHAI